MGEWKKYRLGEICSKIGSGATPRGGSNSYKEWGVTLIRSQNVLDFRFSKAGLAFIDNQQAGELNGVIVKENDILFNITGDSVARCCIVPKSVLPARVNQHVAIIRPGSNFMDYKFLFYYLQFLKPELLISAEIGATRNAMTKGMLENLNIFLPSLAEQKVIASILTSLDDKIDLLDRQNATLEKMAETLFRQWFINNPIENNNEVALGEVVATTSGGTPSRVNMNFYQSGTINWVKSKELKGGFILESEEKITNDALNESSAKIIPANSVLIAMYGATVGEYAIISENMTCNQAVCALLPNSNYPFTYLYAWVKSMKDEFLNLACGAAQQNISQVVIKQQSVSNNIELIRKYHKQVKPYFEKIKFNTFQLRTFTQLRDILLPKLMSGEINIK